jgi:hypothetical protein
MTDNFTYTQVWEGLGIDFSSSAVDNLWYNANERFAVVDWDSALYRYDDVNKSEVENVVRQASTGGSVGRAAQALKAKHGPGTYLGSFQNVTPRKVALKPRAAATREFSLATPVLPTTGKVGTVSENYRYELFFDLDGTERSHVLDDKATLSEALTSLEDAAAALGVDILVKKAVVTFV